MSYDEDEIRRKLGISEKLGNHFNPVTNAMLLSITRHMWDEFLEPKKQISGLCDIEKTGKIKITPEEVDDLFNMALKHMPEHLRTCPKDEWASREVGKIIYEEMSDEDRRVLFDSILPFAIGDECILP